MRLKDLLSREGFWVLCALASRALLATLLGGRLYQMDENGYAALARSIAGDGVYGYGGGEPAVGALGAPLFFSVFYRLLDGPLLARLAQGLVSAATAWGIGRMTRAVTGSQRAGLFALALSSVYPFFIYYSGMLMSETIYVAAMVGALWAIYLSLEDQGNDHRYAATAGLALAAAGLTRTEGVPIALVLGVLLAGRAVQAKYCWKSWVLAALCWALPLAGWAARNRAICGKLTLDLHGGMTLLHGTMLYDIDQEDTLYSEQAFKLTPLYREGQKLGDVARDRLYASHALHFMADNPATTVRHWIQKAVSFWRFYPRLDKVYQEDDTANAGMGTSRWVLVLISLAFEPWIILLGMAGAWGMRSRMAVLFPFYWVVLATFGIHVIVVSQMRYRLPVMPILILFTCAWLDGALRRPAVEGAG